MNTGKEACVKNAELEPVTIVLYLDSAKSPLPSTITNTNIGKEA
jgi:hypothetical protein